MKLLLSLFILSSFSLFADGASGVKCGSRSYDVEVAEETSTSTSNESQGNGDI